MIKDGKLDAIPSSSSLTHPPKTNFTKYDLNSHKVAIVDNISRGQGSEEGRVSPAGQGEFVEVTSKKALKERQRKEKEEQKRQEEERRRDESKKKRKQGGPPRAGSAGSSSERTQHQSSSSKPFSSWMTPIEGESWEIDETLHSHLPVVSAAPGAQLKHPPTTTQPAPMEQQPLPPTPPSQAPPPTTPIQSQPPQVASSSSSSTIWPVDAPKPGVPHTAELVTSDYTLFGGSGGGILSHAVDSTLPIASAMATSASMSTQQQGSAAGGGQKETAISSGEKKREGWQSQPQTQTTKPNEQEPPRSSNDQEESSKSLPKAPRGRGTGGAGTSKNLPPRFKPQQQETSGPGRGRGARLSGRGPVERRGPGRDKSVSQESGGVGEKKTTSVNTAATEQPVDKDKVCREVIRIAGVLGEGCKLCDVTKFYRTGFSIDVLIFYCHTHAFTCIYIVNECLC